MNYMRIFEELEKSTNTGCWQYDVKANKLWWSKQTCFIHGVDENTIPDVISGVSYYHEDDKKIIKQAFEDCLYERKEFCLRLRIIDAHGNLVHVESTGKPLIEDDEVAFVFGTFRDISVEAIKESRHVKNVQRLDNYKSHIEDFFIVSETDHLGVITHINDKFCSISKYSRSELIGKTHSIINSGYHDKNFFKKMWDDLLNGKGWEGQICNKDKDGDLYWVQSFMFPKEYDVEKKQFTSFLAIRFDITDKKNLENRLIEEQKKNEFASQLAAIGEMSAGIAHEINNPLTIILGAIRKLEKQEYNDSIFEKKINIIKSSTQRISRTVKGLHHVAQKSRSDTFSISDLISIIDYTFDFCSEALKSQFIDLEFFHADESVEILCDEVKISQILLNLINNARDAINEADSKERWIKLSVETDSSKVRISVMDSGPGISQDNRDKVMNTFFTTKDIGKGTGLGLPLVGRFVKEHKGTFTLLPNSENTCFVIELPQVNS
ncbi:PAS domain-containing sensor histidine kinase [Bacteriovoracaceae bacterium]|nr:PAS domain-containing sensor histidine kinase [Bacteriovoracaceae bacterium]